MVVKGDTFLSTNSLLYVLMNNTLTFNDLESTVKFLSKVLLNPRHLPRPSRYHWYYLLQSRVVIENDNGVKLIYFCGTNHTTDPNERLFIDDLLSNVSSNHIVLIEQGQGSVGYCQNNVKDDIRKRIDEGDRSIKVDYGKLLRNHQGEMTYATNLAHSRDAKTRNIDTGLNPEAILFIKERYGTRATIREVKGWLDRFFEENALNKYVHALLLSVGLDVDLDEIQSLPPRVGLQEKGVSYPDRDDFMTNEILKELRNLLYVVAHTVHVKEILRRLNKRTKVTEFSATLTHNCTSYNWATATEKGLPHYERGRYIKQRLAMYRIANCVLSKVT